MTRSICLKRNGRASRLALATCTPFTASSSAMAASLRRALRRSVSPSGSSASRDATSTMPSTGRSRCRPCFVPKFDVRPKPACRSCRWQVSFPSPPIPSILPGGQFEPCVRPSSDGAPSVPHSHFCGGQRSTVGLVLTCLAPETGHSAVGQPQPRLRYEIGSKLEHSEI